MRYAMIAVAALLATACLDSLDIVDAEVMALLQEGVVAEVQCPDSLALNVNEGGDCFAFNARGTLLRSGDAGVAKWSTSNRSAVSVNLIGRVTAQSVADTVWIVARGTLGSSDSVQVFSY